MQRPFQRSTAARRTATARPDFRPRMSEVLFMGDVQGRAAELRDLLKVV
jgi:hypothetical protein